MILMYIFTIFVFYMIFREFILDNSNVKQLDFPSGVVVFMAACAVPDIIVVVGKFFVGQLM